MKALLLASVVIVSACAAQGTPDLPMTRTPQEGPYNRQANPMPVPYPQRTYPRAPASRKSDPLGDINREVRSARSLLWSFLGIKRDLGRM